MITLFNYFDINFYQKKRATSGNVAPYNFQLHEYFYLSF